jgi:hypothetical protein
MAMTEDKMDCVLMKQSIQEQISKEMEGMSPSERLAYIKWQVQKPRPVPVSYRTPTNTWCDWRVFA